MEYDAITWVANNPYCIMAIGVIIIGGFIAFAIDCWRKR